MERDMIIYRSVSRTAQKKILMAVTALGLPIAVGLFAYLWLFRDSRGADAKKNGRKSGKKSVLVSKRIKKGLPPGLINLGNTCFANCLLQAIASLTDLCRWIDNLEHEKDKIVLCSLKDVVQVLNNKKDCEKDLFSAMDIIESLSAHGWVGTSQQQDAHEFFQVLMSTLDDELISTGKENTCLALESEKSHPLNGIAGRACREFPEIPITLGSPFKGILANRMTCLKCGYQSVGFDPFESISLRIPRFTALNGATLEHCLDEFTKNEHVQGVYCPGCAARQNSSMRIKSSFSKQLSFAKLPKCLCIHIQRSYLLPNGSSYKNTQFIRYSDIMDLTPYRYNTVAYKSGLKSQMTSLLGSEAATSLPLRGGNKQFPLKDHTRKSLSSKSFYRLNAVIVHMGEVWNGHFVTYRRAIRTQDDWIYSSDEYVKSASKHSVLSSNAYLLFYERT